MTTFVMTAIVLSANVLGAGMAYPQAHKLVRTRRLGGLSALWVGISVAMNAWWLSYGLSTGLWGLVPVSIVSLALYLTIAAVMLHTAGRRMLPGLVIGMVGLALMPVPALLLGGWAMAGIVIGLGYGAQLAPAVIAAFRTDQLDGIASGTWLLAVAEAMLWFVYGVHAGDVALLVGGGVGITMASLLLGRLAVTGHRPFRMAWAVA
jgi:uncharacterized protein with PQ loop repeat